jgi:hypothetical protein
VRCHFSSPYWQAFCFTVDYIICSRIKMITIIGSRGTPEYAAAEEIGAKFRHAWPWIENDSNSIVVLICQVQCHGQTPRDLDLVLIAHLPQRPQFQPRFNPDPKSDINTNTPTAVVESLCVVIEVKDHDSRSVRFLGTDVEVSYDNHGTREWRSATFQNEGQKYSLKNYLTAHTGGSPWIANLIWLRNVVGKDVPRGPSNILPAKFTLNGLLNWIAENTRLVRDGDALVLTATRIDEQTSLQSAVKFLTAKIAPTPLDRRRMDRIVGASVEAAWLDETNLRQLIFRGRGGSDRLAPAQPPECRAVSQLQHSQRCVNHVPDPVGR